MMPERAKMLFAKSIEFGLPREEGSDDQWEGATPPNVPLIYGHVG